MFTLISAFFDIAFSKYQCVFRKNCNTQHCNLKMLGRWKKCVGKGKVFGALLADFSKAFDCLEHKLLTAKLNAYSFNLPASRLIHSYLSNRKQKINIENTYSTWMEIVFGVTHGSILRPLLFFLADLFFIISNIDISSYGDDNTPYIAADNIDDFTKSLDKASTALFQCFDN